VLPSSGFTCCFQRILQSLITKHMLSLEQAKKSLNDPTLSNEEILEIRDGLHALAEIILEKWQEDQKKNRKMKGSNL